MFLRWNQANKANNRNIKKSKTLICVVLICFASLRARTNQCHVSMSQKLYSSEDQHDAGTTKPFSFGRMQWWRRNWHSSQALRRFFDVLGPAALPTPGQSNLQFERFANRCGCNWSPICTGWHTHVWVSAQAEPNRLIVCHVQNAGDLVLQDEHLLIVQGLWSTGRDPTLPSDLLAVQHLVLHRHGTRRRCSPQKPQVPRNPGFEFRDPKKHLSNSFKHPRKNGYSKGPNPIIQHHPKSKTSHFAIFESYPTWTPNFVRPASDSLLASFGKCLAQICRASCSPSSPHSFGLSTWAPRCCSGPARWSSPRRPGKVPMIAPGVTEKYSSGDS